MLHHLDSLLPAGPDIAFAKPGRRMLHKVRQRAPHDTRKDNAPQTRLQEIVSAGVSTHPSPRLPQRRNRTAQSRGQAWVVQPRLMHRGAGIYAKTNSRSSPIALGYSDGCQNTIVPAEMHQSWRILYAAKVVPLQPRPTALQPHGRNAIAQTRTNLLSSCMALT